MIAKSLFIMMGVIGVIITAMFGINSDTSLIRSYLFVIMFCVGVMAIVVSIVSALV